MNVHDLSMTKYKVVVSLLIVLASAACVGTSARLNDVALGMTKQEVISAIGRPDSVSAEGDVEYLVYHWASPKQLIADESNLGKV